jgi:hypothetical protein
MNINTSEIHNDAKNTTGNSKWISSFHRCNRQYFVCHTLSMNILAFINVCSLPIQATKLHTGSSRKQSWEIGTSRTFQPYQADETGSKRYSWRLLHLFTTWNENVVSSRYWRDTTSQCLPLQVAGDGNTRRLAEMVRTFLRSLWARPIFSTNIFPLILYHPHFRMTLTKRFCDSCLFIIVVLCWTLPIFRGIFDISDVSGVSSTRAFRPLVYTILTDLLVPLLL